MFAALAATLAVMLPGSCASVPGSDALWRDEVRFVFVGETHGTAETPAAFAGLTCQALAHGPVIVALEFPVSMQPVLDAAMVAPSDEAARAAILGWESGPFRFHDGRGSEAMLDLLLRLRAMRLAGRPLTVVASVPESPRVQGFGQSYAELDRAAVWVAAARSQPDARVVVLVGRVHAEKARRVGSTIGLPAAAHIRPEESLSLTVAQQGGRAWVCREECGETTLLAVDPLDLRGVVLTSDKGPAFDGMLALGPMSASPPVSAERP